jgi:hypothetical protein
MAALGGAAALFGKGNDSPAPPPAAVPTPTLSTARTPGADVKVGDGVNPNTNSTSPTYNAFDEKRVFGKPLGGLGKGGLGL